MMNIAVLWILFWSKRQKSELCISHEISASVNSRLDATIDANSKIETRHPVKGSFGSEFPATCNHCVVMAAQNRKTLKISWEICAFEKTTLYGKIFKILFLEFSPSHLSSLLCSNFVKFGRQEIGEIVRYLHDRKNNFACLSNCQNCADCTQNLPGPAPNNVLKSASDFIEIGSLSAEL